MSDTTEKDLVMSNLWKLKHAAENLKRLRITDDYTQNERSLIREWVDKANEENGKEENSQYIFKVRGTPKNGLFLQKFTRKKPSTEEGQNLA